MNEELPDPTVMTYFQIDPSKITKDEIKMVNDIKKHLSNVSEDEFEQMKELRDIRSRIGSTTIGTSELEHINKYLKLIGAMGEIKEEMQEMER